MWGAKPPTFSSETERNQDRFDRSVIIELGSQIGLQKHVHMCSSFPLKDLQTKLVGSLSTQVSGRNVLVSAMTRGRASTLRV